MPPLAALTHLALGQTTLLAHCPLTNGIYGTFFFISFCSFQQSLEPELEKLCFLLGFGGRMVWGKQKIQKDLLKS